MDSIYFPPQKAKRIQPAEASPAPTFWDVVAPAPTESELYQQLVPIAREMLRTSTGGVILGDVILEAEARGISCTPPPMADKQKEQRKNSWFARIMSEAGGVATAEKKRSPVARSHGNLQTVWRRREIEGG